MSRGKGGTFTGSGESRAKAPQGHIRPTDTSTLLALERALAFNLALAAAGQLSVGKGVSPSANSCKRIPTAFELYCFHLPLPGTIV